MTTTTKTIEYIRNKRITLEGMTGEGTGNGVEAAALPELSSRGREQRSREMGIIGRDGWEFLPQREGGIWRRKTPHYGWLYPRRGLDNRTPNPIRHHS